MIYLQIDVICKERVRIAGIAQEEHVSKLEFCLGNIVIGCDGKVSKSLVIVGPAADLAVVIHES